MRAYFNDIDSMACDWIDQLITDGLVTDGTTDRRSIADVRPGDVAGFDRVHYFAGVAGWDYALNLAGWTEPAWTGSPPCQPFSTSGRMQRTDDARHLWPEMFRLIRDCQPAIIFGEQVPCPYWLDIIADNLEGTGYTVRAEVRRADAAGFPHGRRRLYWSATHPACIRQPQPGQHRQDASDYAAHPAREADRLVDAFRRQAMPFLCRSHDGVSARVGEGCCKGMGNAIIPSIGAEFVASHN